MGKRRGKRHLDELSSDDDLPESYETRWIIRGGRPVMKKIWHSRKAPKPGMIPDITPAQHTVDSRHDADESKIQPSVDNTDFDPTIDFTVSTASFCTTKAALSSDLLHPTGTHYPVTPFDSPRLVGAAIPDSREQVNAAGPQGAPKCSINNLSEEILLQIVLILFSNDLKSHSVHRTIMAVCHRWREIVINNPLCWTHVEIGSNLYPVQSSFLRSGPTQLVTTTMDFRTMAANNISLMDACVLTVKHHRQLCGLDVVVTNWTELAFFLATWKRTGIATPNLISISVTGIDPDFQPSSFTIAAAQPQYDTNWPGSSHVESLTLFSFNFFALPVFKNLKFLEIGIVGVPMNILQHIFNASPLIETLVVHQYETLAAQHFYTQKQIKAPALRFLGIGLSGKSLRDDKMDDFSRLHAPNLEGLDVQHCQWCIAALGGSINSSSKLQRLRVREQDHYRDLPFILWLPTAVTLEIVQMPPSATIITEIFYLDKLERIIWTFEEGLHEHEVRQWKNFWEIVDSHQLRPRSPMVMNIPKGAEPSNDVHTMLGSTVTVQKAEKWDPWLLGRGNIKYGFSYLDG